MGIALDSTGNVFVTGYTSDCVQEFDKEGNFIKNLGSYGSCFIRLNGIKNEEFAISRGIAVDGQGNMYAAETGSQ